VEAADTQKITKKIKITQHCTTISHYTMSPTSGCDGRVFARKARVRVSVLCLLQTSLSSVTHPQNVLSKHARKATARLWSKATPARAFRTSREKGNVSCFVTAPWLSMQRPQNEGPSPDIMEIRGCQCSLLVCWLHTYVRFAEQESKMPKAAIFKNTW